MLKRPPRLVWQHDVDNILDLYLIERYILWISDEVEIECVLPHLTAFRIAAVEKTETRQLFLILSKDVDGNGLDRVMDKTGMVQLRSCEVPLEQCSLSIYTLSLYSTSTNRRYSYSGQAT